MTKTRLSLVVACCAIFIFLVTACGQMVPTIATSDPSVKKTQIAQTVDAETTRVVALTPSVTEAPTNTPAPTDTPTPDVTSTEGFINATAETGTQPAGTPADSTGVGQAPTSSTDNFILVLEDPLDTFNPKPGASVYKKWMIRNTGATAWNVNYKLVYQEGPQGKTAQVMLTKPVDPNHTVTIAQVFIAPKTGGNYKSIWRMMNDQGQVFGPPLTITFNIPK
jgi:hypothetical protein